MKASGKRIAFIGTGVMDASMVGYLTKSGSV